MAIMCAKKFQYELLPPTPDGKYDRQECAPKYLEIIRWPYGVRCPRCKTGEVKTLKKPRRKPEGRYLYNCRKCRRQFTVTTKTALERTHVPLKKWLDAIALAERKGDQLKASDLTKSLKVTPKTARKMLRKLRRRDRDKFLQNLCAPLKMYKSSDEIFRRIFPDAYAN